MTITHKQVRQIQRLYVELGEHRVRPAISNVTGRPTALRNLTALQAEAVIARLADVLPRTSDEA